MGFYGIVGVWLTMAMIPIAELLPLNSYQLLVLRGAPAAIFFVCAGMFNKQGRVEFPDKDTLITALLFVLACIGLFNAIKAWGANLSAVFLDMAVLVNFVFAIIRNEKVRPVTHVCFAVAIVGSFFAMRGWDIAHLNIEGLLWSLLALVANGLFIEVNGKAAQRISTKVFWWGISLTIFGLLSSTSANANWLATPVLLALWFGIATGLLNFLCAITAFSNLRPVMVGTLVLGVTPSILIGSYFITGKMLGIDQLLGILLILSSVGYLGSALQKKS